MPASPIILGHLAARGIEPHEILETAAREASSLEIFWSPEDRVFLPQGNQLRCEHDELLLPLCMLPVEPTDLIVLAIGVVITVLGPRKLIAPNDHRNALRQHQRREEVADLAAAPGIYLFV